VFLYKLDWLTDWLFDQWKMHLDIARVFSLWVSAMGVDPDKKVGGGQQDRTSMYAVYEYQTSKAGVIIESNFGGTTTLFSFPLFFLIPYILSHLQNPFSVAKSWGLASHPVGPGEARR